MSDNDLIRRGDVFEAFCNHSEVIIHSGKPSFVVNYPNVIRSIPAVPREMTAREYHNITKRMLATDMRAFNQWWDSMRWLDDDEALTFAEKWAREHPKRSEE